MVEPRSEDGHVFASVRLVLLGVTAAVQGGLGTVPLFGYDHRPGATVAFAVFALVTLVCAVWVVRRRSLPATVVVISVPAVLAAAVVANDALPADEYFDAAHWSFGLVGWHLLLLLLDRVPVLLVTMALHVMLSVVQFIVEEAPVRAEIGGAGVVVLSVTSFQLGILVISRVLLRNAHQAAEIAAEEERAATRTALAEQWAQDRRAGFAFQLGSTLPLLVDLADGVLDPRADDTRLRCSLLATQLRRLFAENDDVPDPLVHEVTACLDVAERRGVLVSLAVSGAPVPVPADVRRELTGPVVLALSAARDRARVSLLRTETEVRVAVVSDAGVTGGTTSGQVRVEHDTYGEHTRMEARWRPDRPQT